MAASLQRERYQLVGFGAVFRTRAVEFDGGLPATVPVCSLCRCVPSNHYTPSCKHVYCDACFADVVQTRTSSLRCPLDGKNLRPRKPLPEGRTQSEDLDCLVAFCWNKENGCPYAGPLDDMTCHFDSECTFYEVPCSLCSDTVLRCELAVHVEAAHRRSARRAGGRDLVDGNSVVSGEQVRPTVPPRGRRPADERSSTAPAGGTAVSPDKGGLDDDQTGHEDTQESDRAGALEMLCSKEQLQVLMEDVASRTAEDIKRHSEKLFFEVLGGIKVTKDRLLALAEAARATPLVDRQTVAASRSSWLTPLLQREELVRKQFEWVVGSYSKLRNGIHYVDSPAFLIVPGYRIQLKACIDGIKTAELSACVRVHRDDDALGASELIWPFQRTCAFTLLHNSDGASHVRSWFAPCDAFNGSDSTPAEGEVLDSSWLCIAKMDRNVFERDYVKDDAFTILFFTKAPLD
ncbi:hypothetical protein HPB48_025875 [Haemaphysalis longicornis]|uniref:RING-type domain-containing protein n=1 Tax=Haemaphysalis longicornis TaxID=44386 RepID=A0A9J6GZQ8_HAELO|nr:hypothetical protein HPB48_025875 [Haemaphysalis longicornis]